MKKITSAILVLGMSIVGCGESGKNGGIYLPQAPLASPDQTGDLNGDGTEETVTVGTISLPQIIDGTDGEITFLPGRGDSKDLVLSDVNGNGKIDIVLRNRDEIRVLENDGLGNFTDSGQKLGSSSSTLTSQKKLIKTMDIDGDSDADIVDLSEKKVWKNDGKGNFNESNDVDGLENAQDLVSGDLDGDFDDDVVIITTDRKVIAVRNVGESLDPIESEVLSTEKTDTVELIDLDGDGDLDVVGFKDGKRSWHRLNEDNGSKIFSNEVKKETSAQPVKSAPSLLR